MSKTGITVKILGADGNVFNLFAICRRALAREGRLDVWNAFYKEATSGDYKHALATIADYFDIGSVNDEDE